MSIVSQLQSQMAAMNEKIEQQQMTISHLTSELSKASIAGATGVSPRYPPPSIPPSPAQSSSPMRSSSKGGDTPPSSASDEAMRAAVLAATKEERLAMQEGTEDGDATLMAVEPKVITIPGDVGTDPYLEVPRILYEPDDDDDENDVGTTESVGEMDLEADDTDIAPLAVPA